MKIYLAARWGRRIELQGYAEQLKLMGHTVTSRWLWGHESELKDDGTNMYCSDEEKARFALEDLEDIRTATCVISFTEPLAPNTGQKRGGRHAEFGYAIGMEKRLIILGPREHVFHWLPHVEQFSSWATLLFILEHNYVKAPTDGFDWPALDIDTVPNGKQITASIGLGR